MAWDTLLASVEERFRSVVDTDSIPTVYENLPSDDIVPGTSPSLWRSVSWTFGSPQTGVSQRRRDLTPVRMVVMVSSLVGVGMGPTLGEAQRIRGLMDTDMIDNPIEYAHYMGGEVEIVGKTPESFYQVNYAMLLLFEEIVA